jgi:predicted DNA-binding transcriptional regulator YafY
MASNFNSKLKRLYIIINRLQQRPSSQKQLLETLRENDLEISAITFERDKKTLKNDFGIELVYNSSDYSYTLEYVSKEDLAQIIQFLQYHQLSNILNTNLSEGKLALHLVDFENEYQLKGIEHLDLLFLATQQSKYIEIYHRKFETPYPVKYKFKSYLLKQYQSRWYVAGTNTQNQIRTFGIDRIEKLIILEEKFTPEDINLKELFMGCIGISNAQKKKIILRLQFLISQKEYLDALPLHESQKLIVETETHVTYEYFLVDNFELRQHIFKYGSLVKVLEPKGFAQQIQNELKKALEAY